MDDIQAKVIADLIRINLNKIYSDMNDLQNMGYTVAIIENPDPYAVRTVYINLSIMNRLKLSAYKTISI